MGAMHHCAVLGAQHPTPAPTSCWVRQQKQLEEECCEPGKFWVSGLLLWPEEADPQALVLT